MIFAYSSLINVTKKLEIIEQVNVQMCSIPADNFIEKGRIYN